MAHRTEKEETTEFKNKVHETSPTPLSLCINNCGVTGNPSTNNMCQNCFNSITSTTTTTTTTALFSSSTTKPSTTPFSPPNKTKTNKRDSTTLTDLDSAPLKKVVNRCFGCRKKVGLTGFRCRCGEMFCAEHRYSDRHECSFDYKAAGREAIKRENPVVKAPKIVRV